MQSATTKPITSPHAAERYASVDHGVITLATQSKMEEMMRRDDRRGSESEKLMKTQDDIKIYSLLGDDVLPPPPLSPPLRSIHRSSN